MSLIIHVTKNNILTSQLHLSNCPTFRAIWSLDMAFFVWCNILLTDDGYLRIPFFVHSYQNLDLRCCWIVSVCW